MLLIMVWVFPRPWLVVGFTTLLSVRVRLGGAAGSSQPTVVEPVWHGPLPCPNRPQPSDTQRDVSKSGSRVRSNRRSVARRRWRTGDLRPCCRAVPAGDDRFMLGELNGQQIEN